VSGVDPAPDPWWRRLFGGAAGRTSGNPPSANGASSFHLRWEYRGDAVSASVTLEVLEPPTVDRLYFWALQADFGDARGRAAGGAHLGLQWHPEYPGATAVNWGGYDASGTILDGTPSPLPGALGNPHTRDYPWRAAVPYRLSIDRVDGTGEPGGTGGAAWRGSVTGPDGVPTVVRDLLPAGDRITGVVMWSEVFARCDHPTVAVRWSDPQLRGTDGRAIVPASYVVNYQSRTDGGCSNTSSGPDGVGVVQRTSTDRVTPQGSRIAVPS
jgi:hypothetical protein